MIEEELIRKLPVSDLAEKSVLGSILIDPSSFDRIADLVSADDFHAPEHQQIFLAMRELYLQSHEIDVVTLIDMLVKRGVYDKSGGESYIRAIAESVPTSLNIKDYAAIVRDKSILRQLIEASGSISDAAFAAQDDVQHILDFAENQIYRVAEGRETKNFVHIRDVIGTVYDNLHRLNNGEVEGIPSGFSGLDRVLAGIGNSDLLLVGARPGMGKTSFCLNIGTNVAKATGKNVCIFSLEMSAEQLVTRILSSEALVSSNALRTGKLNNDEWQRIAEAASQLVGCNILIDDTTGQTATAMKAKLRRVKNLGMVIIDYLQLMQSDRKIDNKVNEVADISRAMKIMAKELNVPVVCCSQLSRASEKRGEDKRPVLSDLRDSGAIEQDADVVLLLYRDSYYQTTDKENQEVNIAEVIVAKNRHGETGTVKMGWIPQYTKFRTLASENEPGAS